MTTRSLFRLSARPGLGAALLLMYACAGSEPLGPSGLEAPRGLPGPAAAVAPTNFWATKAPMTIPRSGPASAVVNGVVYSIGGLGYVNSIQITVTTVEAYTPGTNTWTRKAPLPEARGATNGAGVINGLVYVAGGQNAALQPTNTLFVYNPATNTWTTRAPMPVGGGCGVSGVIAGKLYVFVPGCSTPASGTSGAFMRYDPAINQWMSLPGTFPRRFASAAVVGGKLYMAAGQGLGSGGLYDHVVYDPATNRWNGAGSLGSGSGFYGAAGVALGGLFYVIGGEIGGPSSSPLPLLRAYDPGSRTWRYRASLSFARTFPAAAAVNGKLYAFGGKNGLPLPHNEVYTPGDMWITKSSMPSPRGGLSVAVANGKLYAIGGFDGTAKLAVNQMYTPGTDRWTSRAPLPQPRMDANGAAVINGVVYVPGGHNGGAMLRTLYAYNVSANTWATKAAMPAAGGRGASAAIGGKLYVLSGADASISSAKRLDRYDPATNTWRTLAPPLSIHDQPATAVINGKFYVVGGLAANGENTGALEAYDPAINGWTALAPMPTPRRAAAAVVLNGLLYVIGGLVENPNPFSTSTVEVYNPANNTWRPGTYMSIAGFTLASGVINGAIYVVGGYGIGSTAMPFTQVYTP